MSDYRRFVSYMYLYENHVKSMNAGFVKVESRNGQCRISLSLKNVYSGMGLLKIYMFMRFEQELRGIWLGQASVKNHGCEWNFRTETGNIAGSGYALEQMSGMIIQGAPDKFYGTRWDQGDLDVRRFVTEWSADVPEAEAETEEPDMAEVEREVEASDVEKVEAEEINVAKVEAESADVTDNKCETGVSQETEDCERASQTAMLAAAEYNQREKNFAKILEQCPGMYPFEDDAIEACVRLEPQDVGMMPLDCWSYGSNSFLLHGYYSYRHLIFARMKADNPKHFNYILGVPGTHHSREAFMANMFGFKEFKPIREGADGSNDFGYWYTNIG